MKQALASVAVFAFTASVTHAGGGPVNTFRDTLGIPFTAGSGNSNTHFSVMRNSDLGPIELGIKAKERFVGDGNVGGVGDLYVVQKGYSPVSGSDPTLDPPRAWWNFDMSINLGSLTFNDVDVRLSITNNINSQSMSGSISALLVGAGFGGLSVYQDSQNLGFSAFAALGFDATQVGTYSFSLSAGPVTDTPTTYGSAMMTVQVVPMPQAAGLGLVGLAVVTGVRRRR